MDPLSQAILDGHTEDIRLLIKRDPGAMQVLCGSGRGLLDLELHKG